MNPKPRSGEPLRVETLLSRLPDLEGLRPVLDCVLEASRPDPGRRWTASGELGTAGGRILDLERLRACASERAATEARRTERTFERAVRVGMALEVGDLDEVVELALAESGALEEEGRSTEARAWAQTAFTVAHESAHPRAAEALRRSARCARAAGDLAVAAASYEEAFRRAVDRSLWEDAVVSATGRGNISVDLGRWTEAEVWYFRGLGLLDARPRHMDEAAGRPLRWRLHQNLGITHRERGELDASEAWYRRAEEAAAGLDDPNAVIEIRNGRGQLDLARGDARGAEVHFRKSLTAIPGRDANEVRVAVRGNLAEALLRQGRTLEAGQAAREAEAEGIRGRAVHRLPEVYRVLARVARARGVPEAFVFLERALDIVRSRGLPKLEEARTLLAYAELREAEGETDAAGDARARAEDILEALGPRVAGAPAHEDTNEDPERAGGAS